MKKILPRHRVLTFYQNFYIVRNGTIQVARGPNLHRTKKEAQAEEKQRLQAIEASRDGDGYTPMYKWNFLEMVEITIRIPEQYEEYFSEDED
jgi:hypothetical protein